MAFTVTNITDGPKIINAMPVVSLQPGETREGLEISQDELVAAKATEWFSFGKSGSAKAAKAES